MQVNRERDDNDIQVGPKNGANGSSYLIANILKTPSPNSVEIGELLQNYMLNTVINFLFRNFIALWRHLAKTQLLSFIHIVQIDLSIDTVAVFSLGGATAR